MTADELVESAAVLDASAEEAAHAYYDNVVRYGTGKYPKTDYRKSRNWPRFVQVARVCLSHGVPVSKFVNAAFVRVMERHPIVTVNDVCAQKIDEVFKSDGGIQASASPEFLWRIMSSRVVDMVFSRGGPSCRCDVLGDCSYSFPAWFRVFYPESPCDKILLDWGDLAFEEVSEDPSLDAFVRAKRPATYDLLKSVIETVNSQSS